MSIIEYIFPAKGHESRRFRQALAISRQMLKGSTLPQGVADTLVATGNDGVAAFRLALQRYGHAHGSQRREGVVMQFSAIQSDTVIPYLAVLVEDAEGMVGSKAITALLPFGSRIMGILFKGVEHGNRWTRSAAVRALGTIGGARAVPCLIAALQDDEEHVRSEAAEALGNIGDQQATQPLLASLTDPNWLVRESASSALAAFDNHQIAEKLGLFLQDSNPAVRSQALHTLSNIGGQIALAPLVAALDDSELSVQWDAADALGNIWNGLAHNGERIGEQAEAVVPLLAHFPSGDKILRQRIVASCQRLGVRHVIKAIGHPQPGIRAAAAELIGQQAGQQVGSHPNGAAYFTEEQIALAITEHASALAKEPQHDVRMWLVISLGQMLTRIARIPEVGLIPLFFAIDDPSQVVRYHAQRALDQIHDPRVEAWMRQRNTPATRTAIKVQVPCPSCAQMQELTPPLDGTRHRCGNCTLSFAIRTAGDGTLLVTPLTHARNPNGECHAQHPWYTILQLKPDADVNAIRTAFRHLIKQYHPDKVVGLGKEFQQLAEEKTQRLTAALRRGLEACARRK
ncbi:MAG: HEAT repeat domain-containing protein [Mariprofundales bacterium]|nr:HEAT repeat domain-containing protein [Mariprofundales bacterium]